MAPGQEFGTPDETFKLACPRSSISGEIIEGTFLNIEHGSANIICPPQRPGDSGVPRCVPPSMPSSVPASLSFETSPCHKSHGFEKGHRSGSGPGGLRAEGRHLCSAAGES